MKKIILALTLILIINTIGCNITKSEKQPIIKVTPSRFKNIDKNDIEKRKLIRMKDVNPTIKDVNSYSVAKDGKLIVFSRYSKLYSYSTLTNKTYKMGIIGDNPVLSGDGSTLVFQRGKNFYLCQMNNINFIKPLKIKEDISISYDGKFLIGGKGKNLYLFERDKGKVSLSIKSFEGIISNNGRYIAYIELVDSKNSITGLEHNLIVKDLLTSKLNTIRKSDVTISELAFSCDDKILFYTDNGYGYIYDFKTNKSYSIPIEFVAGGPVSINRSGSIIAFTEFKGDGTITILDLDKKTETKLDPKLGQPGGIDLSSNGQKLIFSRINFPFNSNTTDIWVYNLKEK